MTESESPPLNVEINGDYAVFVREEVHKSGVQPEEIVQRAIGLLALLGPAIEDGDQVVIQRLHDAMGLPPLVRIDYFDPPANEVDLSIQTPVEPRRRTHAELASWPLLF